MKAKLFLMYDSASSVNDFELLLNQFLDKDVGYKKHIIHLKMVYSTIQRLSDDTSSRDYIDLDGKILVLILFDYYDNNDYNNKEKEKQSSLPKRKPTSLSSSITTANLIEEICYPYDVIATTTKDNK